MSSVVLSGYFGMEMQYDKDLAIAMERYVGAEGDEKKERMYDVLIIVDQLSIPRLELTQAGLLGTREAYEQRVRLRVATSLSRHFKMDLSKFRFVTRYDQALATAMGNFISCRGELLCCGLTEYGENSYSHVVDNIEGFRKQALELIKKRNEVSGASYIDCEKAGLI